MGITTQEQNVLFNHKVKQEGKNSLQAVQEIQRDKEFEYELRGKSKEINSLTKQIQKQAYQIDILNRQLAKKKNEAFIGRLEKVAKADIDTEATTKHLWRIISLLEAEGKLGLSQIEKTCFIQGKICKSALNFLIKTNIVRQVVEGRSIYFERT